jgi:hypothetical protein
MPQVVVAVVTRRNRSFHQLRCLLPVFLEGSKLLRFPVVEEPEIILGEASCGIALLVRHSYIGEHDP